MHNLRHLNTVEMRSICVLHVEIGHKRRQGTDSILHQNTSSMQFIWHASLEPALGRKRLRDVLLELSQAIRAGLAQGTDTL